MTKKSGDIFHGDLESITVKNKCYRKVLFTGKSLQLVAMTLEPGETIPLEVHEDHDQFIRVDKGRGCVMIGDVRPKRCSLKDGTGVVIPAGLHHEVRNTSKTESLHLYSIYCPPEHPDGLVHRRQPRMYDQDSTKA